MLPSGVLPLNKAWPSSNRAIGSWASFLQSCLPISASALLKLFNLFGIYIRRRRRRIVFYAFPAWQTPYSCRVTERGRSNDLPLLLYELSYSV